MAYLALRTELNPKQHDYVSKIHRAALSLLGIINDILDFSKIEAGKLDVEEIPFSLDEVLSNVASVTSQKAAEKRLAYVVQLPEAVPRQLVGDPLRLGQVLINLVNNAVKFTPAGQIELSCTLMKGTAPDRARLRFAVRDSGIGMDEHQQAKLFHAFSQANGSTTREYGGTGLGLSISQQLVGLMGGRIEVDSRLGAGSTFRFELEFALSAAPQRQLPFDEAPSGPLVSGRDARVLLVEDNVVNQQIAAELMTTQGIQVEIAGTGQQALDILSRSGPEAYDLVLMDLEMPQLDGHAATVALRRDPRFDRLPIVAMTAHALAEIRERCLSEGMQDYITKPVEPEKLYATLARWLGGSLPRPLALPAPPPSPLPGLTGIDTAFGLRNVAGNQPLYLQLLERFRDTQRDAGAAIRTSFHAGRHEDAGARAHALRGVAGAIGARELQTLAQAVEEGMAMASADPKVLARGVKALENAVDDVMRILDRYLDGGGERPEVATATATDAHEALARLSTLLEEFSGEATDYFDSVRAQLARLLDAPAMASLEAYLSRYEFEEARQLLARHVALETGASALSAI
jgi:CheY-like chemotaxis protein